MFVGLHGRVATDPIGGRVGVLVLVAVEWHLVLLRPQCMMLAFRSHVVFAPVLCKFSWAGQEGGGVGKGDG